MKKLIIILILIFSNLIAQKIGKVNAPAVELFLGSHTWDGGTTLFSMSAVSQVWAGNSTTYYSSCNLYLTDDFNFLSYTSTDNQYKGSWKGFDFVLSSDYKALVFGYAKYKLKVGSKYIYLDYRDDRVGFYGQFGSTTGHPIDVWIKFDNDNQNFLITSYGIDSSPWQVVPNGSTVKIWELKGMGNAVTGKFVIKPVQAPRILFLRKLGNKPYLRWMKNTETYIDEYVIYLRENGSPWWEIGRVSNLTTSFIDTRTNTSIPSDYLEYHVKAKSTQNFYSNSSNIVSTMGIAAKIIVPDVEENFLKYKVENYPNPFNPGTNIVFSLSEPNFTNLIVYNSLGETVAILVNDYKEAGSYKISFDGSNLPSGIYFYRIQSGNFVNTKKMILMK